MSSGRAYLLENIACYILISRIELVSVYEFNTPETILFLLPRGTHAQILIISCGYSLSSNVAQSLLEER